MAKLTIGPFSSLTNQSSFLAALNTAFTSIETAFENTLSRDGTAPNEMESDLDMNSNRILNLLAAVNDAEPIRKAEFDDLDAEFDALELTVQQTVTNLNTLISQWSSWGIDDLVGVSLTSLSLYDILTWDGNNWTNLPVDEVLSLDFLEEANNLSDLVDVPTARTNLDVYSTSETDAAIAAAVTAEDLDVAADTGTGSVDLDSQSLTVAGGTGIDTSVSAQTITVAIDATVATLADAQTFSNKTIDLTDNTLVGSTTEFDAALEADTFVFTSEVGSVVQAWDADLDSWAALTRAAGFDTFVETPSQANFLSLITDETFVLDSDIGVTVQAYDADLTTWAGLTPSANAQSLVTAANYAAMRALLDLEVGTDFYSIAAADAAFQPLDSDLTSIAALSTTAAGRSVLTLSDPNEDRLIIWDDDSNAITTGTTSNIATEAAPSSNDFVLLLDENDVLKKVGWDDVGGGGGAAREPGEFFWYCGTSVPSFALECDGSAVSRATYSDLFTAIGTTHGVGDGSTTFNLPDLTTANRFIRGADGTTISVGDTQADAFEDHDHTIPFNTNVQTGGSGTFSQGHATAAAAYNVSNRFSSLASTGSGTETRPTNIALLPCIVY